MLSALYTAQPASHLTVYECLNLPLTNDIQEQLLHHQFNNVALIGPSKLQDYQMTRKEQRGALQMHKFCEMCMCSTHQLRKFPSDTD